MDVHGDHGEADPNPLQKHGHRTVNRQCFRSEHNVQCHSLTHWRVHGQSGEAVVFAVNQHSHSIYHDVLSLVEDGGPDRFGPFIEADWSSGERQRFSVSVAVDDAERVVFVVDPLDR